MQIESNFQKNEIHKRVDDIFNHITKYMGNIFEKIKFNDDTIIEDTNSLEILTSSEAICNRFEDLSNIVNEMKIQFLKKRTYDLEQRKELKKRLDIYMNELSIKVLELQNVHDNYSNILKDWKNNKIYKTAVSLK